MKKINVETFLEYEFLSNPKISPSGEKTAFIVNKASVDNNDYQSSLYLYDGELKKLISKGGVRNHQWIDDKTILFASNRCETVKKKLQEGEEITQYYTISVTGGEAQKLFSIDAIVSDIKSLGDEKYLVTAKYDNNRPNLEGLSKAERKETLKEYKEKGYTVFEEAPFWSNGVGMTNRKRSRLYIYDNKTKDLSSITETFFNVQNAKCKDGVVLYQGGLFENYNDGLTGIYLYNIESKETKTLLKPQKHRIKALDFYLKDKVVLGYASSDEFGLNQNADIYFLDTNTCERKLFVKHDHQSIGSNSTGTDARFGGGTSLKIVDNTMYYLTTKVNHSYLNTLDLKTGEIKELTTKGSVDSFDVMNEKIQYIALKNDELGELYELDNGKEVKITTFNDFVGETYEVSTPIEITSNTDETTEIYGYVMKPVGYVKGNKYPAILHIHGGPRTVLSSIFHNEMQLWANEGYFVFYSNPRGSDGRGNEFGDITGKYGDIDYKDIMAFTDKVLEKYEDIDSKRVGVTGGSYGGFMTNWIIGHTDRFKCACSQRSIANWTTFEGTTDIGHFFAKDQTGASHLEDYEKQWEQSPLKYADKVKTPTLFIHSKEDYRCWHVEALQMFTALKMHGVETKMYLFNGENHDLSRSGRPRNRIKRMEAILNWMNSYLK